MEKHSESAEKRRFKNEGWNRHSVLMKNKRFSVRLLVNSSCYIPIHPTAKSDLILENTPLYDFIFTHLSTKTDSPNHQIPRTSCDKENTKTKYYFNKEGRYFLSVLLLAVASKNIPYTDKSIPGVSLHSINNLFDTFYYAYHHFEVHLW